MRGATRTACWREREAPLASSVGVDAAATSAVLGLHLGAVTHGALAVGLAGLLDGQVHGGAGSRLKRRREQVVGQPKCDGNATAGTFPHRPCRAVGLCEVRFSVVISCC